MALTWLCGVMGDLISIATGTLPPSSAMRGASKVMTADPSRTGRPAKSRFRVASTGSSGARLARKPWASASSHGHAHATPAAAAAASSSRRVTRGLAMAQSCRDGAPIQGSRLQTIRRGVGLERPRQPQGPPEPAGAGRGTRQGQPLAVHLVRAIGVDEHVAVAIAGRRPAHAHLLMPAVLTAHGIRMHGKGTVLVGPGTLPPHAGGVRIRALEGPDSVDVAHPPLPGRLRLEVDERRRPALAAHLLPKPPPAEVMRAGDDPGPDGLGDPDLVHEVADLRLDLEKISRGHAEPRGVLRVKPERIVVRDLVEPLGVARARVDERGQPEGREEQHLASR